MFDEPFVLDGGEFFLSVCAGIACSDGALDAYGLFRDADAAMNSAKESDGDRHVMFEQRLRERALARVALESEIRRGIDRTEFVMRYQSIVDLTTQRWAGGRGPGALAASVPRIHRTRRVHPAGRGDGAHRGKRHSAPTSSI